MTLPITRLVDSSAMTAGDVVESGDNRIVSRRLEGDVTLRGGEVALYGADPATQCSKVDADNPVPDGPAAPSDIAGIVVNDPNRRGDANGRTEYVRNDAVGILQRGAVAVVAAAAIDVSAASDVYVNVATGAFYNADFPTRRRGAFAVRTAYAVGDLVTYNAALYYVLAAVAAANVDTPVDGATWRLEATDPSRTKIVNAQWREDVAESEVGVVELDGPVFEIAA